MNPKARIAKRFAGGSIPLVSLSPGGVAESDTSQGLESYAWACWVDARDGRLRLDRVGDRAINPDAPYVSFLELVSGVGFSHLSLAFDQNMRRVVAWTQAHTVTVSRVAATLVEERQSWAGEDCILFWDGLLLDAAGGDSTEVIAFYLSADRLSVRFRLQSDNFGVEYTYGTLSEPCSLDAIARTGHNLGLYLSPKGKKPVVSIISDPYPVRVKEDTFGIGAAVQSGELFEVIVLRDPVLETINMSTALQIGVYFNTVLTPDSVLEPFTFGSTFFSGVYLNTIISSDLVSEPFTFGTALQSGVYVDIVVQRDLVSEPFTFGTALQGGSYV
jgi:hypothetical protein